MKSNYELNVSKIVIINWDILKKITQTSIQIILHLNKINSISIQCI